MGLLEGKVAVITGGSSGIGLATAKRFVEEGAYVFITGRRGAELEKAASIIGQNVTTVQGDIAQLTDLDHLYQEVAKVTKHLDIVFANAGTVDPMPLAASTPERFDEVFALNTRGTYFTVQKALPLLRDGGSIILCGSAAWRHGVPGFGTYSASKATLVSFVRTWTVELAGRGIRSNVISPGPTETPIIESRGEEIAKAMRASFVSLIPMGRLGEPEEIAAAALFLASAESSFITGIDLPVDGGRTPR